MYHIFVCVCVCLSSGASLTVCVLQDTTMTSLAEFTTPKLRIPAKGSYRTTNRFGLKFFKAVLQHDRAMVIEKHEAFKQNIRLSVCICMESA